jgi:GNAT superfamily N-acetyltransferase
MAAEPQDRGEKRPSGGDMEIRRADRNDIDALIRLRIDFLREMGSSGPSEAEGELKAAIRRYLEEEIDSGRFLAWVAENGGEIAATSGLILSRRMPTGRSPSGLDAYVLNMYTVPGYRKRGLAARLLGEIVRYVKEETPARRIWLRDTGTGRSVYLRAGFVDCDRDMELAW